MSILADDAPLLEGWYIGRLPLALFLRFPRRTLLDGPSRSPPSVT